jgi:hypothetical protein
MHGGVANCDGAKPVCNDGTVSPTCGCQEGKAVPQLSGDAHKGTSEMKERTSHSEPVVEKGKLAIQNVQNYIGVPYRFGGTNREGIDCSGSVDQAYPGHFTRRMTAADQFAYEENTLHEEGIPYDHLQPGDIAYWRSGNGQKITHTAIVEKVEGEGSSQTVTIINAPGKGKSVRKQKLDPKGGLWGPVFAGGARPK